MEHPPETQQDVRVLAVLAAPLSDRTGKGVPTSALLDVWGEWERLCHAVGARDLVTGAGHPWAIVRLSPPTLPALDATLVPYDPGYHIVHISCHGTSDGLLLEDSFGREQLVATAQLITSFQRPEGMPSVRLVVLSACDSEAVGRALLEQTEVGAVLCVREKLDDLEAALLTEHWYRHLMAGATVGEALVEVQQAIHAAVQRGDLPIVADPAQLAHNVVLLGDSTIRFTTIPSTTTLPRFVLYPVPHNHPPHLIAAGAFWGRLPEQRQLADWFATLRRRLFAISGVGGVGKTALALQAALQHSYRFHALAFVSAKDMPNWGLLQVLQGVNASLQQTIAPSDAGDLATALVRRLNHHRVLLVLDNLEVVSEEVSTALAQVVERIDPQQGSRVLVTLRPRPHGHLAHLAAQDALQLRVLDRGSAVGLLWEWLRPIWSTLVQELFEVEAEASPVANPKVDALRQTARLPHWLTRAEVAVLTELVTLSSDHPALIKLTAAMIRDQGYAKTLLRLQRLRGQSIEAVLDVCVGTMVDALVLRLPTSLDVLRAAMMFVDGAEEHHLHTVAVGTMSLPDSDAVLDWEDDVLRPVIDANLLTRVGKRYELEPPVRAYLAHHHVPDPQHLSDLIFRHAEAYLPLVKGYDAAIRAGRMQYSAPTDWGNVAAAIDHLVEYMAIWKADNLAFEMLCDYLFHARNVLYNGHDPRSLTWLEMVLAVATPLEHQQKVPGLLLSLGELRRLQGDYAAAYNSFRGAHLAYTVVEDRLNEANALQGMGFVQFNIGNEDAALATFESALALFRTVEGRLGEATVLRAIGDIYKHRAAYDQARTFYEAARSLFQERNSRLGEANALRALAELDLLETAAPAALQAVNAALALHQAVGDQRGEAYDLGLLGDIQIALGQDEAAAVSYAATLALHRTLGDRPGEAKVVDALSRLALRTDPEHAATLHAQGLALHDALSSQQSMVIAGGANVRTELGSAHRDDAVKALQQIRALFTERGDTANVQRTDQYIAEIEQRRLFASLLPALQQAIVEDDRRGIQRIISSASDDQSKLLLTQLRQLGVTRDLTPDDYDHVLDIFEPLLRGVAAIARGHTHWNPATADEVDRLEQDGWGLRSAIHALWNGERDRVVLTAGLDEPRTRLLLKALELTEHVTPKDDLLDSLLEPMRDAIGARDSERLLALLYELPTGEAQELVTRLHQVGVVSLLMPNDEPDMEVVFAACLPLLMGIVAVAHGQDQDRATIESHLMDVEAQGWQVATAVRAIWKGERNLISLTAGIDVNSAILVERVLELLNDSSV